MSLQEKIRAALARKLAGSTQVQEVRPETLEEKAHTFLCPDCFYKYQIGDIEFGKPVSVEEVLDPEECIFWRDHEEAEDEEEGGKPAATTEPVPEPTEPTNPTAPQEALPLPEGVKLTHPVDACPTCNKPLYYKRRDGTEKRHRHDLDFSEEQRRYHRAKGVLDLVEPNFPEWVPPNVKLEISEWKDIKAVFQALAAITDEATFRFSGEGLKCVMMDPSHIALIDALISKHDFDHYEVSTPCTVGIRIEDVLKGMKGLNPKEWLTMAVNGDEIAVRTGTSSFKKKLIDYSHTEVPLPKLTFGAKLTLSCKAFQKLLDHFSTAVDHIRITSTLSKVHFFGKSDEGEVEEELDMDGQVYKAEVKATYSIEYLLRIMKAMKVSETATLEYGSKMPLKLSFTMGRSSKLDFYLAPRVEGER